MENIYTAVKPFYTFSKVLGLFPLSFVGAAAKGVLKTKCYDVLISSCAFALLAVLIFLKIYFQNFILTESSILSRASTISVLFALFLFLISFWYQVSKMKKIKRFLKMLDNFDVEVSKLN